MHDCIFEIQKEKRSLTLRELELQRNILQMKTFSPGITEHNLRKYLDFIKFYGYIFRLGDGRQTDIMMKKFFKLIYKKYI